MRTHSLLRLFKCSRCNKDFKILRLLRLHEGLHNDIKPFNCDVCGKGFAGKAHIKSHLKIHGKKITPKLEMSTKFVPAKIKTEMAFEQRMNYQPLMYYNQTDIVMKIIKDGQPEQNLTFGDIIYEPEHDSDDIGFFQRLKDNVKKMNEEQKNRFKQQTLSLIDDILD